MNFIKAILIISIFALVWNCNTKPPTDAEDENKPPTCTINSPTQDTNIDLHSLVEINVSAYDEDSYINRVEIYLEDSLLFEDFEYPYNFQWRASGNRNISRTIHAVCFDEEGLSDADSIVIDVGWVYREPMQLEDGWSTATLKEVQIDTSLFYNLINSLNDYMLHRVHGILISRNGKLVFEKYFDGTRKNDPSILVDFDYDVLHDQASVTKSFTSALLGIAIEEGFINRIDEPIVNYFPELSEHFSDQKSTITLEHMINMTSGILWDQHSEPLTSASNDLNEFALQQNPWEWYLSKPLATTPGTVMNYSEGSINVVGECIRRSSGIQLDQFAEQYLFSKLGIIDNSWLIKHDGWVWASGELFLYPRDMLKFGQLYLQNGTWNGEQIVPIEWVNRLPNSSTIFDENSASHEQFWLNNADMIGYKDTWWTLSPDTYGIDSYTANGWGEQRIFVLPEFDMVVVFTGGSQWYPPLYTAHEMMINYILPSIK